MKVCGEVRPCGRTDAAYRKRGLRDAVICIGWLKLISVICYIILYFLVHSNSEGHMSNVIQIMILVTIPAQILHGVLLFLGALEEQLLALELSLWMCLLIASYNTVLGIMGCIYFIRTGHAAMHFILAVVFAVLSLSVFTVICHDILIVYTYKQMLLGVDPNPPTTTSSTWEK